MMRFAIATFVVVQLATVVVIFANADEGNIVVLVPPSIVIEPPPPPAPVPRPPTPPVPDPHACPAPSRDHGVAPREIVLDHAVQHVHPSATNAAWIAAWNDDHVFVSTDGGATFARVLDGPGAVEDVGFDCFGDAIVARASAVGVRSHDGERWRAVPDVASLARVIDGGPDVVVVGVPAGETYPTRIAASSDRGASWRYRDLERAYEAANVTGRQSADGTIRVGVSIADCDYDGLVAETWHPDGRASSQRITTSGAPFGLYGDVTISGAKLWRAGAWAPIAGLDDGAPLEGPWPAVLVDGTVFRIDGHTATKLPWCVDGRSPAIDLAGRVWMIDSAGSVAIAHRASGECHGAVVDAD